jgi:hypothetical protein
MRAAVPAKQRVHRILKGSRCYLSPALRLGRALPKGVVLSPGEELLGGIRDGTLVAILTDRGAYFRFGSGWTFVPYGEVQDVCFPEKADAEGSLTLRTPAGKIDVLAGSPELWTVGRFFMRCKDDANDA